MITTYNGFGFRADDHGGTMATASALGIVGPSGSDPKLQDVDSFGIITQRGDESIANHVAEDRLKAALRFLENTESMLLDLAE